MEGEPTISRETGGSATAGERLVSLDALRGFDMFWIVGADAFGGALRGLKGGAFVRMLGEQLEHSPWEGFTFYDLIFPLFTFMIGVSVTFSIPRMLSRDGPRGAFIRIVRRTVVLFLLGLLYYGGISKGWDHIRLLGVLQRLALCYFFASLAFIALKTRGRVVLCAGLLIGYWALMTWVPVPGYGAGDFREGHNLANWLDRMYLPGWKHDGDHDPEGILSTLPAVATCLLGVFAGEWLKAKHRSEISKALWLGVAGVVAIGLGQLWGIEFPVVKKTWTSSFVLVAGGWSAVLLATFYFVVDIRRHRLWARPFIWIGMNSLSIYLISRFVSFEDLSAIIAGGPVAGAFDRVLPGLGALWLALVGVTLCTLICRFLYQRKIFLRL